MDKYGNYWSERLKNFQSNFEHTAKHLSESVIFLTIYLYYQQFYGKPVIPVNAHFVDMLKHLSLTSNKEIEGRLSTVGRCLLVLGIASNFPGRLFVHFSER